MAEPALIRIRSRLDREHGSIKLLDSIKMCLLERYIILESVT
jgi:hypothetical protein